MKAVERERLIPVKSESELRVGMLLKVLACRKCHADERFIVTGYIDNGRPCSGCLNPSRAWLLTGCIPRASLCCPIREGRLYIVDTGLESADEYRAQLDRERPAPKPARVSR